MLRFDLRINVTSWIYGYELCYDLIYELGYHLELRVTIYVRDRRDRLSKKTFKEKGVSDVMFQLLYGLFIFSLFGHGLLVALSCKQAV